MRVKFSGCAKHFVFALQDFAFSDPTQDAALGQLLVLLQYNWPREEERFASIITAIQKRKKFSIADYLPYIISILLTSCIACMVVTLGDHILCIEYEHFINIHSYE